ncbi:winged helix-turn-helix transcriptional regulator [Haladaptatus halobius]|uniref:winged helix-turn-helix transcriptional regulator n=1 Tax=Haladaptatus halobius TaxID=2884875 RepID=UPI001D0AABB4|nr:winged helix-turn-helix transcriptional regulator [Haladaptatus halobius]
MRKQTSIGLCVLFAFCILSVGPLAFLTATPVHSISRDRHQVYNSVATDESSDDPVTSSGYDWYLFKKMIQIIKESGYDEIGLASVSTTVIASYSRYDESDPLENQVRIEIHDAIKQLPGASISEISDHTGIHRSTVRYHVRILEEEQLTTSKSHRGKHRLYPVDLPHDKSHHNLYAALNEDVPATILNAVVQHGSLTVTGLSEMIDRTPGTVSYHLDRLEDDELVVRNRDGNSVRISTPDEIRELVIEQSSMTDDGEISPSVGIASLD